MAIVVLFLLIFVILFLNFYIRHRPNLDTADGKYILWFNVVSKTGEVKYRDYIELF